MKSFQEFTESFRTNSCCRGSRTAEELYNYICSDQARISLAKFADVGITPLTAIVSDLIDITEKPGSDFSLDRKLHRQTVGRMVAEALFDLGYSPATRGRVLSKDPRNTFSTAVTYLHEEAEASEYIYSEIRKKGK